jgi:hypothetical protein
MKPRIDIFHGMVMHQHEAGDITGLDTALLYAQWYGIRRVKGQTSTTLTRIGNTDLHKAVGGLPIQNKMRRCLILAGALNYYLDSANSLLKDGGAAAVLDGTDGNVMVEIPAHYEKFWEENVAGTIYQNAAVSEYALPGFVLVSKHYISAYEASLNRSTNKLASIVNAATTYRGGDNRSAFDAIEASLLGKPVTTLTRANERAYSAAIGTGWCEEPFEFMSPWRWLAMIEFANTNIQLAVNATLTAEGYRQGGLGNGVTTLDGTKWSYFNEYNPLISCGITNSLGNGSAELLYTMPFQYDSIPTGATFKGAYVAATAYVAGDVVNYLSNYYTNTVGSTGVVPTNLANWTAAYLPYKGVYDAGAANVVNDFRSVGTALYKCILANTGELVTNATYWTAITRTTVYSNSYRGIELPFGHIYKRIDGININRAGGIVLAYGKKGVTGFVDDTATGYILLGQMPYTSDYILNVMFSDGVILPETNGGGATSGFADYYYAPSSDGWKAPLSSASSISAAFGGLAVVAAFTAAALATANFGLRLCFKP